MTNSFAFRLFHSAEIAVNYQFPKLSGKDCAEMILDELLHRYNKPMVEEILEGVIDYEFYKQSE